MTSRRGLLNSLNSKRFARRLQRRPCAFEDPGQELRRLTRDGTMLTRRLSELFQAGARLLVGFGGDTGGTLAKRREAPVHLGLDDDGGKQLAVGLKGTPGSGGPPGDAAKVVLHAAVRVLDQVARVSDIRPAVADIEAAAPALRGGEGLPEEPTLAGSFAAFGGAVQLALQEPFDGTANGNRIGCLGLEQEVTNVTQDIYVGAKLVAELCTPCGGRQRLSNL